MLASMYDIRTKMAREILAELRTHFSDRMLKTVVNFNTKIKEAASFGQPINEYDPASKGQQDFQMLAEELAGASLKQESKHIVDSLADQLDAISTTATELLQSGQNDVEPQIEIVSVPAATEKVEVTEVFTRSSLAPLAASLNRSPETEKKRTPSLVSRNTDAKSGPLDIDAKLSQFYGANQTKDSIVFVSLYPRAHDVKIAGDFNNWQPEKTPMERVGNSGEWRTKVSLANGRYRYRLVVDGQWQQDPYNDNMELNPFGDYNSILEVV